MKDSWKFLLVGVFLVGCVGVSPQPHDDTGSSFSKGKPVSEVHRVKLGMKKSEVNALLGDTLVVGYRDIGPESDKLEPISIPQPYRSEAFVTDEGNFSVLYYVSAVKKADGIISEEELTPLIFKEEVLVGKGVDELQRIKQN